MEALVLDMTHGGFVIAERLMDRGWGVTCVDVYKVSSPECDARMAARGLVALDEAPERHFDAVIMPAHCPDSFIGKASFDRKLTFSDAVKELIPDGLPFRIEVTGVKGKTSACYLLAHILDSCGKKVFLHSSRGQGPYSGGSHKVEALRSIAPPFILELPTEGYDVIISEVSLGGSGRADIAVITNLVDDYGIAKDTRKASDAKVQIFSSGTNFVKEDELDFWRARASGFDFKTFGENCRAIDAPKLGSPLRIKYSYQGAQWEASLSPDYISTQYLPAIDIVLRISESMGIQADKVKGALESFRGVPGRGEVYFQDGRWLVKERNPGISHISIGMTMECLKAMGALDGCFVVVDPVSRKVCDKMKAPLIREVLDGYGVEYVITGGKGEEVDVSGHKTVVTFIKEAWQ